MSTITSLLARSAVYSLALSLLATIASAADEPPASTAANAPATPQPAAPIALNSGVSPDEFASNPAKVTLEQRPDGTRIYHMNGQGMEAVTATIGADGKLELRCTDAAESAVAQSKERDHEN